MTSNSLKKPLHADWKQYMLKAGMSEQASESLASAKMAGHLDSAIQELIDSNRPQLLETKRAMAEDGFDLD